MPGTVTRAAAAETGLGARTGKPLSLGDATVRASQAAPGLKGATALTVAQKGGTITQNAQVVTHAHTQATRAQVAQVVTKTTSGGLAGFFDHAMSTVGHDIGHAVSAVGKALNVPLSQVQHEYRYLRDVATRHGEAAAITEGIGMAAGAALGTVIEPGEGTILGAEAAGWLEGHLNYKTSWARTATGAKYKTPKTGDVISIGRTVARLLGLQAGTRNYSLLSGTVDGISDILLTPLGQAGHIVGAARSAEGASGLLGKWWGGIGLQSPEDIQRGYEHYRSVRNAFAWIANNDAGAINSRYGARLAPILQDLGEAQTPEEVKTIFQDVVRANELRTTDQLPTSTLQSRAAFAIKTAAGNFPRLPQPLEFLMGPASWSRRFMTVPGGTIDEVGRITHAIDFRSGINAPTIYKMVRYADSERAARIVSEAYVYAIPADRRTIFRNAILSTVEARAYKESAITAEDAAALDEIATPAVRKEIGARIDHLVGGMQPGVGGEYGKNAAGMEESTRYTPENDRTLNVALLPSQVDTAMMPDFTEIKRMATMLKGGKGYLGRIDTWMFMHATQNFFKRWVLQTPSYALHMVMSEDVLNSLRSGVRNMLKGKLYSAYGKMGYQVEEGDVSRFAYWWHNIVGRTAGHVMTERRVQADAQLYGLLEGHGTTEAVSAGHGTSALQTQTENAWRTLQGMGGKGASLRTTGNFAAFRAQDPGYMEAWQRAIREMSRNEVSQRAAQAYADAMSGSVFDAGTASWNEGSLADLQGQVAAFNALPEDALVRVYHATTKGNASAIVRDGSVRIPASVAEHQAELGTEARDSLYVSASPRQTRQWTSTYGDHVVSFVVRKGDLRVSPEGAEAGLTVGHSLFDPGAGATVAAGTPLTRASVIAPGAEPTPLRGASAEEAIRKAREAATHWLRNTMPEGERALFQASRLFKPGDHPVGWDQLDTWGNSIARSMHGLLSSDGEPSIARAIADGRAPTMNELETIDPSLRPLVVKGRQIEPFMESNWAKAASFGFRKVLNPIINKLSREPMFEHEFWRHYQQLIPRIEDGQLSEDEATVLAASRASHSAVRFVHNVHTRTQWTETVRNWMPFAFAQEQAFKRAGRLLLTDPGAFRRYQLMIQGVGHFVAQQTGPTGTQYFTMPGSGLLGKGVPALLNHIGIHMTAVTASMEGMFTSANVVFPLSTGFRPDLSPLASLSAKGLVAMFPEMGPVATRALGAQTMQAPIWEQVVPNVIAQRIVQTAIATKYRSFATAMMQTMQALDYEQNEAMQKWIKDGKKGPMPQIVPPANATPHEMQAFVEKVRNQTRALFAMKTLMGAVSPVSPYIKIQTWGLRKDLTAEIKKQGSVAKGMTVFLKKHPGATPFVVSESYATAAGTPTGVHLTESVQAMNWYNNNKTVIDQHPFGTAWLMPQPKTNKYTFQVYNEQLAQHMRTRYAPQTFLDQLYIAAGNSAYYAANTRFQAALTAAGHNRTEVTQLYQEWTAYKRALSAASPIWAAYHTSNRKQIIGRRTIATLRTMLRHGLFPDNPQANAVKQLLQAYDVAETAFIAAQSSPDYSKAQSRIKQEWYTYITAIRTNYPRLSPIVSTVFEDALGTSAVTPLTKAA